MLQSLSHFSFHAPFTNDLQPLELKTFHFAALRVYKPMLAVGFLVIGGGIIDLNLARQLKRVYSDVRVGSLKKIPAGVYTRAARPVLRFMPEFIIFLKG